MPFGMQSEHSSPPWKPLQSPSDHPPVFVGELSESSWLWILDRFPRGRCLSSERLVCKCHICELMPFANSMSFDHAAGRGGRRHPSSGSGSGSGLCPRRQSQDCTWCSAPVWKHPCIHVHGMLLLDLLTPAEEPKPSAASAPPA